jgi:hypothetical protein
VRLILLSAYALAILSSPSIADSPYEVAAKLDMEHLASSVLAPKAGRGISLRVKVDDQHAFADRGERGAEIYGGGRLAQSTFLIG